MPTITEAQFITALARAGFDMQELLPVTPVDYAHAASTLLDSEWIDVLLSAGPDPIWSATGEDFAVNAPTARALVTAIRAATHTPEIPSECEDPAPAGTAGEILDEVTLLLSNRLLELGEHLGLVGLSPEWERDQKRWRLGRWLVHRHFSGSWYASEVEDIPDFTKDMAETPVASSIRDAMLEVERRVNKNSQDTQEAIRDVVPHAAASRTAWDARYRPQVGDTKTLSNGAVYIVTSVDPFQYSFPDSLEGSGGVTPMAWAMAFDNAPVWAPGGQRAH